MTKKLEDVFNLPETKKEAKEKANEIRKDVAETSATAILDSSTLEDHDKKMDTYAEDAYDWAKDIMDLGIGSEPRHSADMFNAAANMMKVALDAKNSKVEKRLKLYDLELKRKKLEMEQARQNIGNVYGDRDEVYTNREDLLADDED